MKRYILIDETVEYYTRYKREGSIAKESADANDIVEVIKEWIREEVVKG